MRSPPIAVLCLAGVVAASALGLVALSGAARNLLPVPLTAEVRLHEFALPAEVAIDRTMLSEALLKQITERANADVALRMTLDDVTRNQLESLIIPRLVNPNVTARLIEEVPALTTIVSLAGYDSVAEVVVENRSGGALADVVVTMPAVARAESAAGGVLDLLPATERRPAAIRLGAMGAGEARRMTAWLALPVAAVQARATEIRVGAENGLDGRVYLFGGDPWMGRDLETFAWARWLVSFLVAGAGLLAAGTLVLMALSALRRKRAPA